MELLSGASAVAAARALLEGTAGVPALAVDPAGLSAGRARVIAIATASGEHPVVVDAEATPALFPLIAGREPWGAHDAKAIYKLLRARGSAPSRWACTRLTELLLLGGRYADLELAAIATRHALAAPPDPDAGLGALATYAQTVARVVAAQILVVKRDQLAWASRLEAAAVSAVGDLELAGMAVDAERWRALNREAEMERQALHQDLGQLFAARGDHDLFGDARLNLDSDAELRAALQRLGHALPNVRRETLAQLPTPLGPKLERFRELGKILSTYGATFLEHLHADGRVHPTFEQIGASTGRMACHAPNLQAMVKDAPYRDCFRAPPGRVLVIGDYATCELRILAEMARDPVFLDAFARGEDLHARVASSMFGKPVSKHENPELRQRAKAINFGLVYGMGAPGLARTIGASLEQAEKLLARYFQTFPRVGQFLAEMAAQALTRGFAVTMTGRRLYLDVGDERGARAQATRIAKNMPIQGTSADITKIALARLRRALAGHAEALLVNAVHDEIVVECRREDGEAIRALMIREMTAAGAEVLKNVAISVDASLSDTWGK